VKKPFLQSLRLDGFLSFGPGSLAIDLRPLNVLIGPNGSGKSNLIEAIELLKAAPSGFGGVLRLGGGADQWIWKGGGVQSATIDVTLSRDHPQQTLRYELGFSASGANASIEREVFEALPDDQGSRPFSFLRFMGPRVEIAAKSSGDPKDSYKAQTFERHYLNGVDPVIAQRKDPLIFPDLAWLAGQLAGMRTFRDWSFGRFAKVRQPEQASQPADDLSPDASNLALLIQEIDHRGGLPKLEGYLKRFLPRFERLSVRVAGGGVALYLHEEGVASPVPASRISDGTLRFIALLAVLLSPTRAPLVCIEEPELGLHPDAIALTAELLKATSAETQIIVTTQSETLVSHFDETPEDIVVVEHRGDRTHCERLTRSRSRPLLPRQPGRAAAGSLSASSCSAAW
jgi:predicted ATPase